MYVLKSVLPFSRLIQIQREDEGKNVKITLRVLATWLSGGYTQLANKYRFLSRILLKTYLQLTCNWITANRAVNINL